MIEGIFRIKEKDRKITVMVVVDVQGPVVADEFGAQAEQIQDDQYPQGVISAFQFLEALQAPVGDGVYPF